MPYTAILNFEELLTPIPGDNPSGENLLYAGLHDEIREARRADDVLAQGEWKRETKTSDWPLTSRLAIEALGSRTKDLQVGAWLTEALVNLHGFAGLHDGLKLLRRLVETFWDTLYPEIDEGDMEARANALDMLNRPFFLATVQRVPITNNPIGANCSYLDYQDALKLDVPDDIESLAYEDRERVSAILETATAEGKMTSRQWRAAKAAGNRAFYEDLYGLLAMCRDEYIALDAAMDEKLQRQSPGLTEFKRVFESVRAAVETVLKEKRELEPDPVAASEVETPGGDPAASGAAAPGRAAGPVGTRQEALRRLGEVAEFFRATEPHSPVPYLLQRAIRWGQIPLEQWLEEVVKDQSTLAQVRETLGLKPGDGQ